MCRMQRQCDRRPRTNTPLGHPRQFICPRRIGALRAQLRILGSTFTHLANGPRSSTQSLRHRHRRSCTWPLRTTQLPLRITPGTFPFCTCVGPPEALGVARANQTAAAFPRVHAGAVHCVVEAQHVSSNSQGYELATGVEDRTALSPIGRLRPHRADSAAHSASVASGPASVGPRSLLALSAIGDGHRASPSGGTDRALWIWFAP